MAFRIAPLRIPSLTTDYSGELNAAAGLGKTIAGMPGEWRKQQEAAETRALLGEAMKTGDFSKAGMALLGAGKVEQGAALIGLGRQAASDANDAKILQGLGLGGAPSASGVGAGAVSIPRVGPPKQGVHVAENEDDVQRLERATGMVTTDADRRAIVKTVYGEAANQPAVGQQAVAAVIRNRANQAGLTPEQITQQRNQFEPWNTEAGRARMNNIPEQRFQQIAGTVAPVIDQGLDPTGGATHFYAPKAQAALGRPAPKWDNGTGSDIADHRFFSLGYGQGGGAPAPAPQAIIASAQGLPEPPAQVAQAPAFIGNQPPPSTGFAPQGQPAPSQVAQAPAQAQPQGGVQPIAGDDPVRLRQEAAYYQQNGNPEAARQLSARADLAERQGGVQQAQAGAADQPAPGASEAQGFVVPGTGEVVAAETIATNPRLRNLAMAMAAIKDPAKRAGVEKLFQLELEATKERSAAELRQADLEGKRLANEKARREVTGLLTPEQEAQKVRLAQAGRTTINNTNAFDAKGETKFNEALGTAQAKRWDGYIQEGDVAQGRLADIQTLRETSRRLGSQGSSANLKSTIGPYAESLGIKVDGLSDIQLYESITNRLAPTLRAPGSGSTSDIEFKGFMRAIGPLSNAPAAREMILDTFEAASRNDIARSAIASRLASGEINRGDAEKEIRALPNPLDAFRKFREANPDAVGQAIKEAGKTDAEQRNAPPRIDSADAYGKLKSGDKFMDSDGNVRIKR